MTAQELLPALHDYLGAIAAAHGEEPPSFDEEKMSEVLTGLLESEDGAESDSLGFSSGDDGFDQNARDGSPSQYGFDPDQPRASDGEWVANGGSNKPPSRGKRNTGSTRDRMVQEFRDLVNAKHDDPKKRASEIEDARERVEIADAATEFSYEELAAAGYKVSNAEYVYGHPVKPEGKPPSKKTRIMGEEMELAETQEHDGIVFDRFETESGGAIRVIDKDSGNVISVKKYPALESLKAGYESQTSKARKMAGTAQHARPGESSHYAFDPASHPRGQPDNAGQFGPGVSGRQGDDAGDKAAAPAPATSPAASGKSKPGAANASAPDQPSDAAADYKANGTRAAAFKAWFGDWERDAVNSSKVVDAGGNPNETHQIKKVFHGTTRDFTSFDSGAKTANASDVGLGFYFAEDERVANSYADGKGGKVLTVYLNIRKPFDFSQPISGQQMQQFGKAGESLGLTASKPLPAEDTSGFKAWHALYESYGLKNVNAILAKSGYDGIVHLAGDEDGGPIEKQSARTNFGRCWIAFEPHQIKSVDNAGTFDPKSAKIHESKPGTPSRYATDAAGHEHRGKGVDGGQFTGDGAGGDGSGQPAASAAPQQPAPPSTTRGRNAAAKAAHGERMAAHTAAVEKQAAEHDAAHSAWESRDSDRTTRSDAAYDAGEAIIATDRPSRPEIPSAEFAGQMLSLWTSLFGEDGQLDKELAAVGANEKERKRILTSGLRGADALTKFGERAAAVQAKVAAVGAKLAEHEQTPRPAGQEEERPANPANPYVADNAQSEAEWDAAIAAQEAWDEAYEKIDEAQSAWDEKHEALTDKADEAQEKADDAWSKLDDGWDAWTDKLLSEVQDVQAEIRSRIDAEGEADPEPDEPDEIEEPEEPDEEDEEDEEEEPEEDEETEDEDQPLPAPAPSTFSKPRRYEWNPADHPRGQPDNAGQFGQGGAKTTPEPAPAPSPADAAAGHKAKAAKWVAAASLPDEVKQKYAADLAAVLEKMPTGFREQAEAAIAEYGGGMAFHADFKAVNAAFEKVVGQKPKGTLGGFVTYHSGGDAARVNLDGGKETGADTAQGIYAHEMAHATDVGGKYSNDAAWKSAWKSEIFSGRVVLSLYAREDPAEGFAELHRAICSKGVDACRVAFPKCIKFLEAKGLL